MEIQDSFGERTDVANGLTYKRMTATPEATKELAASLAPFLQPGDVIMLTGDLGAGKTQFVQGVARQLGITDQVVSPTFNILLTYESDKMPLYHFDLYRLEDAVELEDVGYYDVVDADGVVFIEWGDKFADVMPYGYLEIDFAVEDDGQRTVYAHSYGERARQLLFVWAKDPASRLRKTAPRTSSV